MIVIDSSELNNGLISFRTDSLVPGMLLDFARQLKSKWPELRILIYQVTSEEHTEVLEV